MITIKDVENIAKLSKLSFDDKELQSIHKDLINIFNMIEEINKVDTENVFPLYSPIEFINEHLRDDVVDNTLSKKDFLENTFNKDEDFVIVPKIVD